MKVTKRKIVAAIGLVGLIVLLIIMIMRSSESQVRAVLMAPDHPNVYLEKNILCSLNLEFFIQESNSFIENLELRYLYEGKGLQLVKLTDELRSGKCKEFIHEYKGLCKLLRKHKYLINRCIKYKNAKALKKLKLINSKINHLIND